MVYIGKPAPDLAQQIDMCWSVMTEGDVDRTFYEILPDSNVNLTIRFSSSGCRMVLLGPATEKASIEIDNASDYFCIRFRPAQVPRLVDVSPSELINGFVDIPKIRGMSIDSLADRLHSLPDAASRQRVMEDLVRGSLPLVRNERCRQATALLDLHGGRLQVGQLAAEMGIHIRALERLFLEQLGMTPKRLIRLVRLQHLLSSLRAGSFNSLTDLAHACGYTDQSHMIKDFKELTGRLPGESGCGDARPLSDAPLTGVVHRYRP